MKETLLGKKVHTPKGHDLSILHPLERPRREIPMFGFDVWRAYELAWLNTKGKPEVGILEIIYPYASRCIIESKSLKLYLNGLSYVRFPSKEALTDTIRADIVGILDTPWLIVNLMGASAFASLRWQVQIEGVCIDSQDIEISQYSHAPGILTAEVERVSETLFSELLRSNCPITKQPDWGMVLIEYTGPRINRASLLGYICSYRDHEGFAESCCEQIFMDIWQKCSPEKLLIHCLYTRRGGIDINPLRASFPINPEERPSLRLVRQ
jgi:7-cyano-7-deazaguanine reductase